MDIDEARALLETVLKGKLVGEEIIKAIEVMLRSYDAILTNHNALEEDLYSANCIIDDLVTVTREIKMKDEYLLLIDMMLYDYDGCKTVKTLKELIDETRKYIHKALKNDDKSVITVNSKKKFNILGEEAE